MRAFPILDTTMRLHLAIPFLIAIIFSSIVAASEVSWMFQPGYYTHSPITGKRVAQYEPDKPSYVTIDPTYQESGYRHQLIQNGTDWLNLVQTWARARPSGLMASGSIPIAPARRLMVLGAIRKDRGRCRSILGRILTV